jgi:imidazolonepropionase
MMTGHSLLFTNIERLYQVRNQDNVTLRGEALKELPFLEEAFLLLENGFIKSFGPSAEAPERADQIIDVKGQYILPAWCDSHTHIVYAESREQEFVDRILGLTYEEIAQKGGGILNSARLLQNTHEDILFDSAFSRLKEVQGYGTGALEIKSGYGLDPDSEYKMLRVIRRLKDHTDMPIKSSFLGAHAIPAQYKNNRSGYIQLLTKTMIPKVAGEGLADYCDVFCDRGFFSPAETDQILKAAMKFGLKAKIRANELGITGGVQVGISNNAISVDHLECIGEEEIELLSRSQTIATLLPSTAFFLNIAYAPARKLIESGAAIALASDYNPGSTPSGRVPFILSLACIKMQMLPEEAINAVTINGAAAMEILDKCGTITPGKMGNLIVTKKIPSLAYIPYSFGSDLIDKVVIKGKVIT